MNFNELPIVILLIAVVYLSTIHLLLKLAERTEKTARNSSRDLNETNVASSHSGKATVS